MHLDVENISEDSRRICDESAMTQIALSSSNNNRGRGPLPSNETLVQIPKIIRVDNGIPIIYDPDKVLSQH